VNEVIEDPIVIEYVSEAETYVTLDGDFDLIMAREDNVSSDILFIGDYYNYVVNDDTNTVKLQGIRYPYYGKWCGPGYGSGKPIDLLDLMCKAHDNCYDQGTNHCKCDRIMVLQIQANRHYMKGIQRKKSYEIEAIFIMKMILFRC
jgi:hypothetical protein